MILREILSHPLLKPPPRRKLIETSNTDFHSKLTTETKKLERNVSWRVSIEGKRKSELLS